MAMLKFYIENYYKSSNYIVFFVFFETITNLIYYKLNPKRVKYDMNKRD